MGLFTMEGHTQIIERQGKIVAAKIIGIVVIKGVTIIDKVIMLIVVIIFLENIIKLHYFKLNDIIFL
jgi:hypothetical protein